MSIQHEELMHLQDEELVQLLDREVDDRARAQWQDHLAGCLPCAERLHEMANVSEWLHEHAPLLNAGIPVDELARARAAAAVRRAANPPVAPTARTFIWARAAAAAGIILLGALTVEPVRAWVFGGFGNLVNTAEAPAPVVAAPSGDAGAAVSFQPTETTFRIQFVSPQAGGTLTIGVEPGVDARAQAFGGATENLSVLPAALLVENAAGSTADYAVTLPAEIVRRVEVSVGGEVIFRSPVSESTEPVVVDLAVDPLR